MTFIHEDNKNKIESFKFLNEKLMKMISCNEDAVVAFEKELFTLHDQKTSNIVPCNHGKDNTRVLLHSCNIVSTSGIPHDLVKMFTTDVLFIAMARFLYFELDELWIKLGSKRNRIYIPIQVIYKHRGHNGSKGLLYFPAFTRCDQV